MPRDEYEIIQYHPDLVTQVTELMPSLWSDDHNSNVSHFKWKYHENPFTEYPLGIVALHKGKVVAFRGYLAAKWQIQARNSKIMILSPGDTVVHPDHRRKGLSVAMGNMATDQYASEYKVFLNFTAGKSSVPGYLRLGFIPLCDKTNLKRSTPMGFLKSHFAEEKKAELHKGKFAFGQFGDILVSEGPRPQEMYTVISKGNSDASKIALMQNENFFRWRFENKMNKYIFYYHRQDNITTGFVVMGVSLDNRHGYILDYAETDIKALEKILRYVIKMKHFDIVSINDFGLSENFSQILKSLGFKANSLIQIAKRTMGSVWPLLVRPVKREYVEDDWFIEGLDIRKIESWKMKGICSDAA